MHQGVVVSRLAAIPKEKLDGTTKIRLIVFVELNERILLPRIRDVVADLMSLVTQNGSSESWARRVVGQGSTRIKGLLGRDRD